MTSIEERTSLDIYHLLHYPASYLPDDGQTRYPAIVALHGHGSNERDLIGLAPRAIKLAGGEVNCFGAPVDPGNLLLTAGNGTIGLDLGAQTSEEVVLSIMAEVVAVRWGSAWAVRPRTPA